MVRSRTWPSPGVGAEYSSRRKSDGLGSPTGREARTMRFADWDMAGSSELLLFVIARSPCDEAIHSFFAGRDGLLRCARNDEFNGLSPASSEMSGRNLRQRRLKRGRSRRQIREGKPAIR